MMSHYVKVPVRAGLFILFVVSSLFSLSFAQVTGLYTTTLTVDSQSQDYTFMVVNLVPSDLSSCKDWIVDDPDFSSKLSSPSNSFGQLLKKKKYVMIINHGWQQKFAGPDNVIWNSHAETIKALSNYLELLKSQSATNVPKMSETAFVCITWPSFNIDVTRNNDYVDTSNDAGTPPWNYYDMVSRAQDIGASAGAKLLNTIQSAASTLGGQPIVTLYSHSIGTVLVAEAVLAYKNNYGGRVDSLVLLEATMPALSFTSRPSDPQVHLEGYYHDVPKYLKRALVATHSNPDYDLHYQYPLLTEMTKNQLGGATYFPTPRYCGNNPNGLPTQPVKDQLDATYGAGSAALLYAFMQAPHRREKQRKLSDIIIGAHTHVDAEAHTYTQLGQGRTQTRQLASVDDLKAHALSLPTTYQAMGGVGVKQTDSVGSGAQVDQQTSPPLGTLYQYDFSKGPASGWPYVYSIDGTEIIHWHTDVERPECIGILWQAAQAQAWEGGAPTVAPTLKPTTVKPTAAPTVQPTNAPTAAPTPVPSPKPTSLPTVAPTTIKPTIAPTAAQTPGPTSAAGVYACDTGSVIDSITLRSGTGLNAVTSYACKDASGTLKTKAVNVGDSSAGTSVTVQGPFSGVNSGYAKSPDPTDAASGVSFIRTDGSQVPDSSLPPYGTKSTGITTKSCPSGQVLYEFTLAADSSGTMVGGNLAGQCRAPP